MSKKLIHLLKSPFVVHPKTGRVCVPIDVADLDAFDPLAVPTVTDLLAEIDAWDSKQRDGKGGIDAERGEVNGNGNGVKEVGDEEGAKRMVDYEKTRLKPFVEYFKQHVASLLRAERGIKREREEGDAMEF